MSLSRWQQLVILAQSHNVAPLLYYALEQTGCLADAPPHVSTHLKHIYLTALARNTWMYHELARVLDQMAQVTAFHERPTSVIVLKGAALANTIYPHIGLRPMQDVDLLIQRNYWHDTLQILRNAGYVLHAGTSPINLLQGAVLLEGSGSSGAHIDLHWNLFSGAYARWAPPLEWFWSHTEQWYLSVPEMPSPTGALQLRPEVHLFYLTIHTMIKHRHDNPRLLWFYDVHLLLNHYRDQLDWQQVLRDAEQWHWGDLLHDMLLRTRAYFGTALPSFVYETLQQNQAQYTTQRREHTKQLRLTETPSGRVWTVFRSLSWTNRLVIIRATLFPDPAYLRQRYRPQPAWLLPLYYPYRWFDLGRDILRTVRRFVPIWWQRFG